MKTREVAGIAIGGTVAATMFILHTSNINARDEDESIPHEMLDVLRMNAIGDTAATGMPNPYFYGAVLLGAYLGYRVAR